MIAVTNLQHFNKGFSFGFHGQEPKRTKAGPRVTPAFAAGYRVGRVAFWQHVARQLGYNYGPGGFIEFYANNVQPLHPTEARQMIKLFRERYP